MPESGNEAQLALIAEQVVRAAIAKLRVENPELITAKEAPLHPLVKWVVGTIAALGLAAIIGGGTWLISSVSAMQITLARLDERMGSGAVKDARFDEIERRVSKNEAAIAELKK